MKRLLYILPLITVIVFACQQDTVRNTDFSIQGIDVSHYQSRIDWNKIAQQDFSFAFVKASEGLMYVDSLFEKNWAQMREVGLKRGAYHFFQTKCQPIYSGIKFHKFS